MHKCQGSVASGLLFLGLLWLTKPPLILRIAVLLLHNLLIQPNMPLQCPFKDIIQFALAS